MTPLFHIELYSKVPTQIGSFISSNFNLMGDERNYTPEFFKSPHYSIDTISVGLISHKTQLLATTILKFYKGYDGPWLSYFIVDQNAKRLALGTNLMNEIKCIFPIILLECWSENREAFSFYTAQKFKEIGSNEGSIQLKWER